MGFEYIYAGAIFREESKKKGLSIEDFCHFLEENPEMDKDIDRKVVEFALDNKNSILEGRLAGWMVYNEGLESLKILLTARPEVSAERVAYRDLSSPEDAMRLVKMRDERDRARYKKLYNIDISDESIYDLVIDTSAKSIEEEVDMIVKHIK